MRISKVEYQEFGLEASGYPVFRLNEFDKPDQAPDTDTPSAKELIRAVLFALSALGPCEVAEITGFKRKHGAIYVIGFHECFALLLSGKVHPSFTFEYAERLIDGPEFYDTRIYIRYDNGIPEVWLSRMWDLEAVRACINTLQPLSPSLLPDLPDPVGILARIKASWQQLWSNL